MYEVGLKKFSLQKYLPQNILCTSIDKPSRCTLKIAKKCENSYFCSTLSDFENCFLCERILINVTTCQNETSS
jgi:hypothetical protein